MVSRRQKSILQMKNLLRKGWRFLLGLMLALFLVVAIILVVMTVPLTRTGLLQVALGQVHRFLPGELTVAEAEWPKLGRLEFEDIVWQMADGDTLAQVSNLKLEVDLQALRDHDLLVRELILSAGRLDLPGILQLFPANSDSTVSTPHDSLKTSPTFLRQGDFPSVPSIAVESFKLEIRDALVSETLAVPLAALEGNIETRLGYGVSVHLGSGEVQLELLQDQLLMLKADNLALDLNADCFQREFELEKFTIRVPEAGTTDMRHAWLNSDPAALDISGHGQWTDTGLSVVLDGAGALPGPEHVRPILPTEFPEEITGLLVGEFKLVATIPDLSTPDPTASVRMDFSDTGWMDRFLLVAAIDGGRVTVDTLDVGLMGARLAVSGTADSTEVDARVIAEMAEPTLLHLLGGPALADAQARFEMEATLKGPWPLPDLDLDLNASASTSDIDVPVLKTRVRTQDRKVQVSLGLDQGISTSSVVLDSLQLNWDGNLSHPDSLTHRFDLGAWSPVGRLALGGTGTIDTLRTVILDSLVIASLDSTMRTTKPATVIYGPGSKDLRIEDFRLAGGLGSVDLNCSLDETGLTLQLALDLLFKESFLAEVVPNEFWSKDGGTDLSINGTVNLEGGAEGPLFSGKAGALLIPHRDKPEIGADLDFFLVQGDSSGLGANLALHADKTTLLSGSFRWPGHPDVETGKWIPDTEQGLEVRFPHQEFNLAQLNQVMPPDMSLDGVMAFGATLDESMGSVEQAGLGNALINGKLAVGKLDMELPNRSRLALSIDTALEGSVSDPVISGKIKVLSGYFRIPEMPRALLPVQGESLLWQAMEENSTTSGDSLVAGVPEAPEDQGPVLGEPAAIFLPDIDLTVEMPGNVIVNGYGLNIELEGNLQATRGEDFEGTAMVVLKGHAGVRQGTLKFMNNIFDVEKADIRFNKAAPPNPNLNIQLVADITGYLIYLKITGFADAPEVELSSEPEMNEVDIIAVLLFGQPANDLDNDQRGRAHEENDPGDQLRENLAAMAVMFGGANLQNQMSNTLGVDMVEMGSDSEGESTLVVGKFLTPRVLLKYNQSLEKSGTYFMTMEYRLSQNFKLISTYGQGEEASGMELKWTRRY